jgi:2,3-bisphosphoglycerate-independent phosphoglycerate mutase
MSFMNMQKLISQLKKPNTTKIVVVVVDGLGGLPIMKGGKTELETAHTPNLDLLVADNVCGLATPVMPGITPGSGPGHLGIFGYDPLEYEIGRGVLETLGIDFQLDNTDIAARGNFCSINTEGNITDRRAGRISTETCITLVNKLKTIIINGVTLFVEPVKDYRFSLIIRGENLGGDVEDTDPQITGIKPLQAREKNPDSKKTAEIINEFITKAKEILKNDHPANMITFRGIGKKPKIPTMEEVFGVKSAAIAVYPMYRGIARLVGMKILGPVKTLQEQIDLLQKEWNNFDYFFLHYKYADSRGEDGKFEEKVACIEELDSYIPHITALRPDVLIVTGDHSSPATMKGHSFHPVPLLLASKTCRPDHVKNFGEIDCLQGGLGQFEMKYMMPLALAHAGRIQKYGA